MKKKYELPSIEMVRLVTEDIIVTSSTTTEKLQTNTWTPEGESWTDFSKWA